MGVILSVISVLILMCLMYIVNGTWITYEKYFESVQTANLLNVKSNCGKDEQEFRPGDCRPVY